MKHRRMGYADIIDGTSNTILIIEAGRGVDWTKPEDLIYDPDQPLPELGGLFEDIIHVAFCDGSVQTLRKTYDEKMMRAAITRNGSEAMDFSQLQAFDPNTDSKVSSTGDVRGDNKFLKQALVQAHAELARVKADLQVAKEALKADAETARIKEENAQLRQAIQKVCEEILAVRAELEQLQNEALKERREKNKTARPPESSHKKY
jgi:hypothetical protein